MCSESRILESYNLIEGVDVIFPSRIALEGGMASFQVNNRGEEALPVTLEWFGNSPESGIWNISKPETIGPGEEGDFEIEATGDLPLERSVWVAVDSTGIVVHLSARCPLDGC